MTRLSCLCVRCFQPPVSNAPSIRGPWPSGLKAQPGFPRALASRRPLGAWQWLGTRANPAGRRPATGRRPSREEACITLLRIASRGVAAQPSKKKLFVLRPSSLVFVLVDLVVLRIHVRRITARGACSSEVAVDAAPLLLDRVVSIVPSSLSILHPRRTSSRQPP